MLITFCFNKQFVETPILLALLLPVEWPPVSKKVRILITQDMPHATGWWEYKPAKPAKQTDHLTKQTFSQAWIRHSVKRRTDTNRTEQNRTEQSTTEMCTCEMSYPTKVNVEHLPNLFISIQIIWKTFCVEEGEEETRKQMNLSKCHDTNLCTWMRRIEPLHDINGVTFSL